MNPRRLLDQFDRVSEAPEAIPRLRRFILDLAVRGKLVEHDREDEPASDLLARIQSAKARLASEQTTTKARPLPSIAKAEMPFGLPSTWAWVRVGDAFLYDAGDKRTPKELDADRWLVELEDIEKDTSVLLTRLRVSDRHSLSTKSEFQTGDVLYGKLRPYLNKVVVAREPGYSTTEIVAIRPFVPFCAEYLCLAFRRPDFVEYVLRLGRGTKMPRLRAPDALRALFPLPPLAEQYRIAAKVDELIALCDRLAAAQAERERRRDRLTAASLHHLNRPANAADVTAFGEAARFHISHLPRFTTRPDQIPTLRQTILSLAFQGHLTAQFRETEVGGESAQDHLAHLLRSRTQRWVDTHTNRKTRKCPDPAAYASANVPPIPESWVWTSADAICSQITDGEHIQPDYQTEGLPMLSAKHVRDGYVTLKHAPLIAEADFERALQRCSPENGDILVVSVGATTGRVAIIRDCPPFAIVRSVLLLKPLLSAEFLQRWLQAEWCFKWMAQASGASAQPHLYIRDIKKMPVPLPPIREQRRIVAKVDELLAVCSRLEAQLSMVQTHGRRLLDAVLHEALVPAA